MVMGKPARDCTALVLLQLLYDDALHGTDILVRPLFELAMVQQPHRASAALQRLEDEIFGFRNKTNFKTAVFFHCGGLDLYPANHSIPG